MSLKTNDDWLLEDIYWTTTTIQVLACMCDFKHWELDWIDCEMFVYKLERQIWKNTKNDKQ